MSDGPFPCTTESSVRSSASAGMEAIDLTHDDDGTYIPPAKRPRPCDDSDVEVVEEASSSQGTSEEVPEERQLGDGEELVVLRERGQVRG